MAHLLARYLTAAGLDVATFGRSAGVSENRLTAIIAGEAFASPLEAKRIALACGEMFRASDLVDLNVLLAPTLADENGLDVQKLERAIKAALPLLPVEAASDRDQCAAVGAEAAHHAYLALARLDPPAPACGDQARLLQVLQLVLAEILAESQASTGGAEPFGLHPVTQTNQACVDRAAAAALEAYQAD